MNQIFVVIVTDIDGDDTVIGACVEKSKAQQVLHNWQDAYGLDYVSMRTESVNLWQ